MSKTSLSQSTSRSLHCCCDKKFLILIFLFSGGGHKLWKRLSLFVAIPAVGLCMLNTYLEHQKMTVHRPEFKKYEYLHIRNKRFPWGDGSKSLFHVSLTLFSSFLTRLMSLTILQNPHVNALPDGYEDDGGHH